MEIYLIILMLVFFLAYLQDLVKDKLFFTFISVILLSFFGGIRFDVGTDFLTYEYYFHLLKLGRDTYMEPGFETMTRLIYFLGFNEQGVFFISSFITCFFFYKYIKENSVNIGLSYFIFFTFPIFYLASFNGIRQFIAVSLFIFSIKYIKNKNILKYLICVIIAASFHKTAIVLLPLYFVLNRKLSVFFWMLLFLFLLTLSNYIPHLLELLGIGSKYTSTEIYDNTGLNLKMLFVFFILLFVIYKSSIIKKYHDDYNIILNMLFIVCMISIIPIFVALPSAPVIRMTSYFSPVIIIVLGSFPDYLKHYNVSKTLSYMFLSVLLSCYFIANIYYSGDSFHLTPYRYNINLL
ncbi:EpsG family protein [Edwardsiella tarda]|uniref:EpsG family protein n=1 Tax=Edwardsiella tarda TaxID=636 RepID=UPI0012FD38B8|nr:EpsG family protein [Edwardsiella tarda]